MLQAHHKFQTKQPPQHFLMYLHEKRERGGNDGDNRKTLKYRQKNMKCETSRLFSAQNDECFWPY